MTLKRICMLAWVICACICGCREVPSFAAFTLAERLVTFGQAVLLVCDTLACVFYPFLVGSFASFLIPSLPWAEQVRQDHTFRAFMRNMFIILSLIICCCQTMLASQHVPRNLVWDTVYNITTAPMFIPA